MPGVPQFTVLTSTYNRAHAIHRVYDSLRGQTLHDFEWLAVDEAHGQLLVPLDSDDACVPRREHLAAESAGLVHASDLGLISSFV